MALEPVKLDDLTWADMMLAIRRRIAGDSDGKWTLHAPVDPGVTLLELFAWLLEQRLYWMDQVPDTLVRAAIKLLGEELRPAQSAATVLRLSTSAFSIVPAMTEMRLVKREPGLIFSTDHELTLLPVERIRLFIADKDRTADLEQERGVNIFPFDGRAAEVQIILWLRETIPTFAAERMGPPFFALLFDLRTPSSLLPEWHPEATCVGAPPPTQVTWWYRRATGQPPVPFPHVEDGTGGFRRSGVVRLPLPTDWQAEDPAGDGLTPYAVWIRVAQATFTAPPRLERLIPNVVIARHQRQTQMHELTRQWLPLPGRQLELAELPEEKAEKDFPPLAATVKLQIRERVQQRNAGKSDEWHEWRPVTDLAFSNQADRHFVVDHEKGLLRFGDGLTGHVPVLMAPTQTASANVKVQYAVGGGRVGNVGANRDWEAVTSRGLTAKNVTSADGGKEPETIAEARERVVGILKRRDRAITREDYEELALTTPGVAIKRAHAAVGFHPGHPCTKVPGAVTVFIVPDAPRDEMNSGRRDTVFVAKPIADPGALAAVRNRLAAARLVTSEVFVRSPQFRPVVLTVTVEGDPSDPNTIREDVEEHLRTFLDPLVGGDARKGWPFGEPLRPSVLLRETQRALGEVGEAMAVSIKLGDSEEPEQDCSDVRIGEHELITLHEVKVQLRRSSANRPAQGGLR